MTSGGAGSVAGGPDDAGRLRAWSWVRHLRAGGTTPWSTWPESTPTAGGSGVTGGSTLPGAQQLELLRRLNVAAGGPPPGTGVSQPLVQRVLTASAPGRGRPDFQLVGAVPEPRFGPGLVDPGALPVDELVRVATGLLAEDLVVRGADLPDPRLDRAGRYRDVPHRPRRPRLPRRWRPAYLLGGDPWLVDAARHHLVAQGRPPGGRDAVAVLVGTDLGTMLVDAWTARCFGDGAPPWREFLAGLVHEGRLPPRADLAGTAARWSRHLGPERVAVVLDPVHLPRLVGVRRPLPRRPGLAAHATELARQVGPALGLLVTPPRVAQLLIELLLPRLAAVDGQRLVVPAGRERWVRRQARRQREALLGGDYPVHGDVDRLRPVGRAGVPQASLEAVLDLALRLLLEAAPPTTQPVTQESQ